jgi:hypothetical protein
VFEQHLTLNSKDKDHKYGTSVSYLDYVLENQIKRIKPQQIVDFGAGGGKNGLIARQLLNKDVHLIAVESFENTVSALTAQNTYNKVYHSLIQDWVGFQEPNQLDLAIFGDVLEHLKHREIHMVLKLCIRKFKNIIIVCPLYDIFQGEVYGNPLETHQTYIKSTFFDHYKPVEKHIIIGDEFTLMNLLIRPSRDSIPSYRRLSWFIFHNIILILQPIGLARQFVDLLKRYAIRFKYLLRG